MLIMLKMLLYFVFYLISAVEIAMLARALLSWIVPDDDSAPMRFLYAITEPFIAPIRALMYHFNIGMDGPLDIPFFVTVILLSVIGMTVGAYL
ncbi:MAG: YggT family protein [Ruminococcaceae bacterium]|nr:YggT family protein [Oscillospiraceae bacterium]